MYRTEPERPTGVNPSPATSDMREDVLGSLNYWSDCERDFFDLDEFTREEFLVKLRAYLESCCNPLPLYLNIVLKMLSRTINKNDYRAIYSKRIPRLYDDVDYVDAEDNRLPYDMCEPLTPEDLSADQRETLCAAWLHEYLSYDTPQSLKDIFPKGFFNFLWSMIGDDDIFPASEGSYQQAIEEQLHDFFYLQLKNDLRYHFPYFVDEDDRIAI